MQVAADVDEGRLVLVANRDEHPPGQGQLHAGAELALGKGEAEIAVDPHDLAGRFHFRSQHHIASRETCEGEDGFLHRDMVRRDIVKVEPGQFLARHHAGRDLGQRHACRLGDEGNGAAAARVHLEKIDVLVLDGELHIHQPDNAQRAGQRLGLAADLLDQRVRQGLRRQRAGRVAGMNAGFLDMFHDAADIDVLAVAQRVDINLDGVVQEAVDQHRVVAGNDNRVTHVALEIGFVMHHLHRAPAKNIGRADDDRQADTGGDVARLFGGMRDAVLRLAQLQIVDQLLEPLAVFGKVDGVRAGSEDRDVRLLQRGGDLQRRLAAKLDNDAMHLAGLRFAADDFDHILVGQRLEIQPVRGVIVGRHRFRVAVDHDGLVAGVGQRVAGMDTAIVEFDSLADPVRAAAEDDHLLAVGRRGFALGAGEGLVTGIHIGGLGGEFGGAGVDALEHRMYAGLMPRGGDRAAGLAGQFRHAGVGEPHGFQALQRRRVGRQPVLGQHRLGIENGLDPREEPAVPAGDRGKLVHRHAGAHGLGDAQNAEGNEFAEPAAHRVAAKRLVLLGHRHFIKAGQPGLHRTKRFLQAFLERTSDSHRLAHGLHRCREFRFRSRELLEGKARDLRHDIVDGRLEARRGHAGDVVRQLVQRIADGQFRRDLGNREAGGL